MRTGWTDPPVVFQSTISAVHDVSVVSDDLAVSDFLWGRDVHWKRARRFRQWWQRAIVHDDAFDASSRHFDFAGPQFTVRQSDRDVVHSRLEIKSTILACCFTARLSVDRQEKTTRRSKKFDDAVFCFLIFRRDVRRRANSKDK